MGQSGAVRPALAEVKAAETWGLGHFGPAGTLSLLSRESDLSGLGQKSQAFVFLWQPCFSGLGIVLKRKKSCPGDQAE